jgi:tetratricopeptide (TPR) repeat protein
MTLSPITHAVVVSLLMLLPVGCKKASAPESSEQSTSSDRTTEPPRPDLRPIADVRGDISPEPGDTWATAPDVQLGNGGTDGPDGAFSTLDIVLAAGPGDVLTPPLVDARSVADSAATTTDQVAVTDVTRALVDGVATTPEVVAATSDAGRLPAEVVSAVDTASVVPAGDIQQPDNPVQAQVDAALSRKVFDEFAKFVKDGSFDKGIQLLEEWLKQSPMDLTNRQNLIHVLLKLERYEQALPHLSFMADEAENKGEWLGHFGRALARLGEYARAAEALEKAVDLLPKDIDLRLDLAKIYATRKDYPRARAVLNDSLKLEQKLPELLKELATVLVELGEYTEAFKRYRQLQRLEPTYETALIMAKIASQYERCEDVVDALADWEKDFVDETPHLLLGACASKAKEPLKAQKHYLLGLKANDKCYYCALWMGDIYFELQDWDNSVKYYAMAAPMNPRDYRAFHQLGKTLANQGEHIRAARALQKADERKANDSDILYALGMELVRAGERKDAWDVWAKLEPLDRARANEIKSLLVQ